MKVIIGTGKSPNMPKGVKYTESNENADLLVSIGAAVYEGTEVADITPDTANPKFGETIKQDKPKKKK
jgi:hypothetical protein